MKDLGRRKQVLLPRRFFEWAELNSTKIRDDIKLKMNRKQAHPYQPKLKVYERIVRAFQAVTSEEKLQLEIPIALSRKEAKVLYNDAAECREGTDNITIPEYERRIKKNPHEEDKYKPYVEKARQTSVALTLGMICLQELL